MLNQYNKRVSVLDERKRLKVSEYILRTLHLQRQPRDSEAGVPNHDFEDIKNQLLKKGYIKVHPQFNYNRELTEEGLKYVSSDVSFAYYEETNGNTDIIDFLLWHIEKNGFYGATKCDSEKIIKALNRASAKGYIIEKGHSYNLTSLGLSVLDSGLGHKEYEKSLQQSSAPQVTNNNYGNTYSDIKDSQIGDNNHKRNITIEKKGNWFLENLIKIIVGVIIAAIIYFLGFNK